MPPPRQAGRTCRWETGRSWQLCCSLWLPLLPCIMSVSAYRQPKGCGVCTPPSFHLQMLKPGAHPPPVVAVDIPSGWVCLLTHCLPTASAHYQWPLHSYVLHPTGPLPFPTSSPNHPITRAVQLECRGRGRERRRPAPRHARLPHRPQAVRQAVCGVAPLPRGPLCAATGGLFGGAGLSSWRQSVCASWSRSGSRMRCVSWRLNDMASFVLFANSHCSLANPRQVQAQPAAHLFAEHLLFQPVPHHSRRSRRGTSAACRPIWHRASLTPICC